MEGIINEKYEKPKKIEDPKHVIYWCEQEGIFLGSFKNKVQKFIEHNCVKKTEEGWEVKPIEGYNHTTHKVKIEGEDLKCSCQGFQKNGDCSHLAAIRAYTFKQQWNG